MRFFLFFLFLLPVLSGSAQILNIEKVRLNPDSTRYLAGNLSANFSLSNRTAAANEPIEFLGVNTRFNLAYVANKHLFLLLNRYDYLRINEAPFNNFFYAHFRVNFLHQNRLSPEVFSQYQFDFLRGLDNRLLGGAGARYALLSEPKVSLAYGLGAMYEQEEWRLPGSEDSLRRTTNFAKASQYISFGYQLNASTSFDLVCYHQFGYDPDFSVVRHRINGDVQLTFTLIKNLKFNVNFTAAYETAPVIPITKFIYNISNGVQYNF